MTNLIKETIQAEVASLQAQLDLIEARAGALRATIAQYQELLEAPIPFPPQGENCPADENVVEEEEVEIELVYEEEEDPIEEEEPVVEEEEQIVAAPQPTTTSTILPPVADIRKAISLGDRFLFQRELFAGNGELMTKTIEKLNGLSSLEEAMEYITKHFNWDNESQAYELFVNILKRRF